MPTPHPVNNSPNTNRSSSTTGQTTVQTTRHTTRQTNRSYKQLPESDRFRNIMTIDPIFIQRLANSGSGTAVAIKDLIDLRGTITTAACKAVERRAVPATEDAACLAGIRAAEADGNAWIVGKTNLHELAFGAEGINGVYGTPPNPIDASRIPGGSSSGSAVAVALGLADVALGSDTGGSIRIPAACCGIVGLKTTHGRVPLQGVWPLAPFLDTVGPMARNVADVVHGMNLLEPGFALQVRKQRAARSIARIRPTTIAADPAIDAAVDQALLQSGVAVVDVTIRGWDRAHQAGLMVLLGEAWLSDAFLLGDDNDGVTPALRARLHTGDSITETQLNEARGLRDIMRADIISLFASFDALALPSMPMLAPTLEEASASPVTGYTRFANMTGLPALSVPVPVPQRHKRPATAHLPTSLQLIGNYNGEAQLVQLGALVERAVA
jgi:amidase